MVRESVAHLVKVHGVEEVRALGPQEGGVWVRKSRARAGLVWRDAPATRLPSRAPARSPPAGFRGWWGVAGACIVRLTGRSGASGTQ